MLMRRKGMKHNRFAEIDEYDIAILDINLQGFNVKAVAEAIASRAVLFVFLSGYASGRVPDQFRGKPVLHKRASSK